MKEITTKDWIQYFPRGFSPREEQIKIINFVLNEFKTKRFVMVNAATGCHRKGQQILMYDGTLKNVEDIIIGDTLMGPDNEKRNVLSLVKDRGQMVKIKPTKGKDFVVNIDHILTLIRTNNSDFKSKKQHKSNGKIIDVSVREWLNWSKSQKHLYKLFHSSEINFNSNEKLEIDPYFLGVLLGDGSISKMVAITSADSEIIEEIYTQAKIYPNLKIRIDEKTNKQNKSKSYYISSGKSNINKNQIIEKLKILNLYGTKCHNKYIPLKYKISSIENRKQILAGLLDTDAHLSKNINSFDYISKSKQLSEDVCFISRSLGLLANIVECKKKDQYGTEGTYFRVCISGNTNIIPTKILRKQAKIRKQKKDVLRTGFSVELLEKEEDYFGFVLDKDHRYLLDDFLVTHNCGKSFVAITIAKYLQEKSLLKKNELYQKGCYILTTQKILQEQYIKDFGIPNGEMCSLKSSTNYECDYFMNNSCSDSLKLLKSANKNSNFYKSCSYNCKYKKSKKLFLENQQSLTNFPFFLTSTTYDKDEKIKPRELLILDEAHSLEENLSEHTSISFSEFFSRDFLKIKFVKKINDEKSILKWVKEDLLKSIEEHIVEINCDVNKLIANNETESDEMKRLQINLDKLTTYRDKVNWFLENYTQENWCFNIIDGTKHGTKIEFKSIDVGKYSESLLFRYGEKVLLMSATILDKDAFCENVGISSKTSSFIDVEKEFDSEKSPILYFPVGKMTKDNIEICLPSMKETIEHILSEHKNEKGIIHTHNYKIANYLIDNIKDKKRLITHKSENKDDIINEFMQSTKPLVLVSPSSTEGLDLKNDLSRFQIICKIPFPFLGDKLVLLRKNKYKYWYDYQTAKTIIQSRGRSIRNENDYAVTYILDESWEYFYDKNKHLFPKSFKNALKRL